MKLLLSAYETKSTKNELQIILSEESSNSHDALIQTIAHYLNKPKNKSIG